jgi:hypothetical protein
MNQWSLARTPNQRNHGLDHVGSGTAVIAVGLLVERNPVAAAGIFAFMQLHVVCHDRGRHDSTRRLAGRHQYRARAQSTTQTPQLAAQALSQQGRQA